MMLGDLKYALRIFAREPGFVTAAMITLALAIGANTALFSVVNAVLFNPLPYKKPDQLVAIYSRRKGSPKSSISYLNFQDWERENRVFSAMAAFLPRSFELTGEARPQYVRGEMVSATFFPLLGVRPVAGRLFDAKEDKLSAPPVVLISEGFWKREFGGARHALGKMLPLNGREYTVVGVIPDSFSYWDGGFGGRHDVYVPIGQWDDRTFRDRRASLGTVAVARLKAGVTLAEAQANMGAIAVHLAEEFPNADMGVGVQLVPLKQDVVGNVQPALLLLLAAAGFVLLIACANLANLLLARSTRRAHEIGIRAALGASPRRLIRQQLIESSLLSAGGGALGLALAVWGTHAGLKVLPAALPRSNEVGLDGRVLLFTLGLSLLSAILFGLSPALKSTRANNLQVLKMGSRGGSGGRQNAQTAIVCAQTALAVVLTIGAGLMIRTLTRIWETKLGFDPNRVLTFGLSSPTLTAKPPAEILATLRQVQQQIEKTTGVRGASLFEGALPMTGLSTELPFWMGDEPEPSSQAKMKVADYAAVQPGFFGVMGIPLMRGRLFTPFDNEGSQPVVVVDEAFVRLYLGRRDPLGRRINLDFFRTSPKIVGVVGHLKRGVFTAGSPPVPRPQMYLPLYQVPSKFVPLLTRNAECVVKTEARSQDEFHLIRESLVRLNSELLPHDPQTMREIIAHSLAGRRFVMILLSVFAGLALSLACVGIYGVVSYLTTQRAHEFGIRLALGAGRWDVLFLALKEGAEAAIVGIATGLTGAYALTRLMAHMLYGVRAYDPLTFVFVTALILVASTTACFLPAWRATRLNPAKTLRSE